MIGVSNEERMVIQKMCQVADVRVFSIDDRVSIDAYYVRNWSIWLDLVLLVRTAKALVLDRGAC